MALPKHLLEDPEELDRYNRWTKDLDEWERKPKPRERWANIPVPETVARQSTEDIERYKRWTWELKHWDLHVAELQANRKRSRPIR